MAITLPIDGLHGGAARLWRGLLAGILVGAIALGGAAYAANNSVQGAKKPVDDGYDADAPTAILIEASSGSVLFEKNADELRAPSSMMKLMTAEVVFNAIKQGDVKLNDQYHVSENAWRKGGAPAGGSTMFAALHSRISIDDLLHGAIIQSGNDACMVLAEGLAGNEVAFAEMMTKRARELGLTRRPSPTRTACRIPATMTVREPANSRAISSGPIPNSTSCSASANSPNKIRQQNRNPLLTRSTAPTA